MAIRPWYAPKNPSLEDICMSDVNTKDLHPEIWRLFDRYVHGLIDRAWLPGRRSKVHRR